MRDVAIVAFAQSDQERRVQDRNEVELLTPVIADVKEQTGMETADFGFTCSGSTDYLAGQAFSFVLTLDSVGPWPPISESHVEMDGAWAMYEAWVKIQTGAIDTALVYAYGKSSPGDLRAVMSRQLDPYYLQPLWPDSVALAALQARAVLDSGAETERDWAEVAARNRRNAESNDHAQLRGSPDPDDLLDDDYVVAPLRRHACPPITDGAAAIVIAAEDKARELSDRPAWIRGLDHRIDAQSLGVRDLTVSSSAATAAGKARVGDRAVDFAELHAPFAHQEGIVRRAMGLGDDVSINPSGGAMAANAMMTAGLIRVGEAATRITNGDGDRAVAHATSGACLQQNLVCVLEGA
ncbi:MAG: thiolase domain-containing protein [Acidimicrobiales bacterium]|nr:thiolase domain-containing protein [Acidimicrobiales bacterium]